MNTLSITIPGFTIAYRTWGKPSNPPILALHGWLDNANSFEPLAQYLQDNYYLIAIDFPGHGHSSHLPDGCHYHFTDGIFILTQIINALGLTQVHLLGHSMGACLASLAAGITPDRFLSLALIEGLGPFSAPPQTACKQLANYLNHLTENEPKTSKAYQSLEKAARARSIRGYVSLEIAAILCERGLMDVDGTFYWRHDQRLLIPSPLWMTEEQILSCLHAIHTKTHLITATNGFAFDQELMPHRINAVNNLTVTQLEGGHHIHMEQPKKVADILLKFMINYQD